MIEFAQSYNNYTGSEKNQSLLDACHHCLSHVVNQRDLIQMKKFVLNSTIRGFHQGCDDLDFITCENLGVTMPVGPNSCHMRNNVSILLKKLTKCLITTV